jgi:membrane fusion protein, multidrug efflux system
MKTVFLKFFPILALAILAGGCNIGNAENKTAENKAKLVKTAKVNEVDYQEVIFASGQLSSREESKLSFKTGGIIRQIYVREGQTVREGQLLAELNLDEIRAQTQQADLGREQSEITIRNAELALELAERDYRNALGLYRDSVATLEQLENAEVQLKNARNQLDAARKGLDFSRQNVDVANFNLRYSRIVAPSNGVILKKLAENNEVVGPGMPVFLFGSKDKAQVIKVSLTDKDIIHVQLDDEAEVAFDAYPRDKFRAVVRELAGMADPYTNTYEVILEVFPDGRRLLSGFIGTVNIFTNTREKFLEIPIDALLSADKRRGDVFVLKNGTAKKTSVDIFRLKDGKLLVENGLDNSDEVIVSGVGYLEDGDVVIVK